jgi:SAM-dependent methyltransferase
VKPVVWGADPEFFGPRHQVRIARIFRALAEVLPPPGRVLDAGCGAGSVARGLAARGYTVSGMDGSAAFIAHAEAQPGPSVAYQIGDLATLPYPDGAFEAVVSSEVLEHVADDARAVAELARVLVPGGWAIATVPADPALWDASDDWAGHVRRYAGPELRARFEEAGFEVVRLTCWGFPLVRLYHRHIFLRVLARKGAAPDGAPEAPLRGWKRQASRWLALLLDVDRLFDGRPEGIGWLLVAQKRPLDSI